MFDSSDPLEIALYTALVRERPIRDAKRLQELISERNDSAQEQE